jgi:hypothetical protein
MSIDLKEISKEIKELLEERRKELRLSFVEEKHIYYMLDNKTGKIRSNYPSVSKVLKKFHPPFDAEKISLMMAKGDRAQQKVILEQWKQAGDYSTNMGSRVHYELETDLIARYGNYKKVRQPIYTINEEQTLKSDNMIVAGKEYLDLMEERGAILIDTETILGDPELGYTGQPDKSWLMLNKTKDNFGLVITDWKSNQPKNFERNEKAGNMYPPFQTHNNNSLSHYNVQIPLYARLLKEMLKNTKYKDLNYLGGVIVLLKDDKTYVEYKVPSDINNGIMRMDLTHYVK